MATPARTGLRRGFVLRGAITATGQRTSAGICIAYILKVLHVANRDQLSYGDGLNLADPTRLCAPVGALQS
jgi:hypothetical protein